MLGFGALGELALGEGNSGVVSLKVFATFSQPGFYKVPFKVEQQPQINFEIENPKDFNPKTPSSLTFIRFSEPLFIKKVLPNQYTEPRFEVEATRDFNPAPPAGLVFASFPNQVLAKKV